MSARGTKSNHVAHAASGRRFPLAKDHRDGGDTDTAIIVDHLIRAMVRNMIQALYVLPHHKHRLASEAAIVFAVHGLLYQHVAKPRIAEIVRHQMRRFMEIEQRTPLKAEPAFAKREGSAGEAPSVHAK
jgi:hypothetical protein